MIYQPFHTTDRISWPHSNTQADSPRSWIAMAAKSPWPKVGP